MNYKQKHLHSSNLPANDFHFSLSTLSSNTALSFFHFTSSFKCAHAYLASGQTLSCVKIFIVNNKYKINLTQKFNRELFQRKNSTDLVRILSVSHAYLQSCMPSIPAVMVNTCVYMATGCYIQLRGMYSQCVYIPVHVYTWQYRIGIHGNLVSVFETNCTCCQHI